MYSQQQYGDNGIANGVNVHAINGNSSIPSNVYNGTWVQQGLQVPIQTAQSIYKNGQGRHVSNMPAIGTTVDSNHHSSRNNHLNTPGKPQYAHISYTNTPNGGLLTRVVNRKLKRKRTTFSTEQVQYLETIFLNKPYVCREERLVIEDNLHINEKAIKVWFQNRRLKEKREAVEWEAEMNSPRSPNTNFSRFDRLSYVENLMKYPDERGYVTLDDRALSDMAAVIHEMLPKDILLCNEVRHQPTSSQTVNNNYEPISPAAPDSHNRDETLNIQEFLGPQESLQYLLDY